MLTAFSLEKCQDFLGSWYVNNFDFDLGHFGYDAMGLKSYFNPMENVCLLPCFSRQLSLPSVGCNLKVSSVFKAFAVLLGSVPVCNSDDRSDTGAVVHPVGSDACMHSSGMSAGVHK